MLSTAGVVEVRAPHVGGVTQYAESMARGRAHNKRSGGHARKRGATRGRSQSRPARTSPAGHKGRASVNPPSPAAPLLEPGTVLRFGVVPGTTPGRWVDAWHERVPQATLSLVAVEAADAIAAVLTEEVDIALLRLPVDGAAVSDDLHMIRLYDELPVVIAQKESHLLAADELTPHDLAGEVVLSLSDNVLGAVEVPHAEPTRVAPLTTEQAIETVASGVGVVIAPMSLARLYRRRDVDYRPLTDGPRSPVALVWHKDRQTPAIDLLIGIVRGRTVNSSR